MLASKLVIKTSKKHNLGILFNLGDSFISLHKTGQDVRLINEYLKRYLKVFHNVYLFSYANEKRLLPKNCILLNNQHRIHRFLYQFLLPFYFSDEIKIIDVFRVMQLGGVIPAILIKILYGKPFIFTYGYDYATFASLEGQKIRPVLFRFMEKLAMKFAAAVIVTNKKMRTDLTKKYPWVRMAYIPNGADINKFNVKFQNSNLKVRSQDFKVLFVGRLEKQKNLFNLIKAASLLKSKHSIELLFIGQGTLLLQLSKLAKRLKVRLQVIAKVSHDKIAKYYQGADVFVLPSYLEGHPKVLLEAMACGLPCLVANFSGVEEFKNKEEILITDFADKEIAKNLELLFQNDGLRQRLSKSARKRIEKDFNIENLLGQEVKLLQHA